MLKYRIVSGVSLLGGAFLLANYGPAYLILVVLLGIAWFAQREFYLMLDKAAIPSFRVVGSLCGVALILATFLNIGPSPGAAECVSVWEHVVMGMTLMVIFVRQFPQKRNEKPLETISCTLLGIWYVPYLFNYFTRLAFAWEPWSLGDPVPASGKWVVLYLVTVVKFTDIGAYTFGRIFGRHKLFPRLSPGKTWEGFAGGVAVAVAASLVFRMVCGGMLGVVPLSVRDALALGVLLAVAGVLGDMFESLVKRAAGVKDSSDTIPGMGGILDVIDSLLFGVPILYYYLKCVTLA